MNLKEYARYALESSRRLSEGVISSLGSEEDWLYQAHPKANHPLWIVGHLGLADNNFISKFRPKLSKKPDGWEERFWFGSKPKPSASDYPPVEEVLAYFRERRKTLLAVLADLSDEELSAPAPAIGEFSPIAGAPNVGYWFLFAAFHEGMHTGQLTVAHRGLGNDPLFQPSSGRKRG